MALDQSGFNIFFSVIFLIAGLILLFFYNLTPGSKRYGRYVIRFAIGFTLGSVLCLQLTRQFASTNLEDWEKYLISSIAGVCLSIFYGFFGYFAFATLGLYFGLIISSIFWANISSLETLPEGAQLLSDTLSVTCALIMLLASKSDNNLWELILTFVHAVCGAQLFLEGLGCFINGEGSNGSDLPVIQPYWVFFGTSISSLECKPAATTPADRLIAFMSLFGVSLGCTLFQIILFSVRTNCMLQNWSAPRQSNKTGKDERQPLLDESGSPFNPSGADIEDPDEGALEFTTPINGFTNNGTVDFIGSTLQSLRVVNPLVEGLRFMPDLSDICLALRPKALSSSITAVRERIDIRKFPLKKQNDAHEFFLYLLEFLQNNGAADLVTRCFQAHVDRKVQCFNCGRLTNLPTEPVLDVTLGVQGVNSLNRAWSKDFAEETIKDYDCEFCHTQHTQARKTTALIPPANPEYHLALALKWFIDDTKLNQNFDIPLVIDIGGTTWSLVSVIYHTGSTPKDGHYYSWSKWEGQWYEANDENVTQIPLNMSGRYEVFDVPYVLIFQRREQEIDGSEGIISYRHVRKSTKQLRKVKKEKEVNPFEMDSYDPRMRERVKPATRVYYRICLILTLLFGFWWIIWLIFYGHYFNNAPTKLLQFVGYLEYTIYTIAEIINFFLNGIYFFNFWKPVNRRWRSLNNLKPDFTGRPTVNCLICHYQEDVNDTRRTLNACLKMIQDGRVKLNIFICDDGYFEKGKDGKIQVSQKGYEMTQMIREELLQYWTEKGMDDVRVLTNHTQKTIENKGLVRLDCATKSHRLEFRAYRENGKALPGPYCFLIAREKPKNHHNKAGNLNNCIYNEKLKGEFVLLLDNDMAPLPKFLMRTIPWFYRQTKRGRYRLDEGVAFIQCPQDFENVDQEDFLGNRNSIFFQAIQKGRDGMDSCAFAGTNAVFLLKALHSIGGVPYGTVTEDAYAGILLHRKGYRSYYIEEPLAVGLAPETSAQSMVQRMRWVKGSIQILLLPAHFHDDTAGEQIQFVDGYKIPKVEISPKMKIREDRRFITRIFRTMFKLDTMLYPFSAITAIMYMIVTLLFIFFNVTPIGFEQPGGSGLKGYASFTYTFLPYFLFRFLASLFSVTGTVSANDVWRAQEIWFSYAFCSLVGVIDAFYQKCRGIALFSWGNTAALSNTVWLEWFNILMVFLMGIGMIVRTLAIFRGTQCFTDFAALMFTGSIMMQLWPMVSISLWQRIYNRYPDENGTVKKAGRIEIPNYLMFTITVVLGILISEAGSQGLCIAGDG